MTKAGSQDWGQSNGRCPLNEKPPWPRHCLSCSPYNPWNTERCSVLSQQATKGCSSRFIVWLGPWCRDSVSVSRDNSVSGEGGSLSVASIRARGLNTNQKTHLVTKPPSWFPQSQVLYQLPSALIPPALKDPPQDNIHSSWVSRPSNAPLTTTMNPTPPYYT